MFWFIADLWEAAKVTRASSSGPISRICRRLEAKARQTRMVWLPSTRLFPQIRDEPLFLNPAGSRAGTEYYPGRSLRPSGRNQTGSRNEAPVAGRSDKLQVRGRFYGNGFRACASEKSRARQESEIGRNPGYFRPSVSPEQYANQVFGKAFRLFLRKRRKRQQVAVKDRPTVRAS